MVWTTDSDGAGVPKFASAWRAAVSDPNYDRKRELERLRLASDLMQLAADTVNPDLKEHCLRRARIWSGEPEETPVECTEIKNTGIYSVTLH